jgi:hypothetical protein
MKVIDQKQIILKLLNFVNEKVLAGDIDIDEVESKLVDTLTEFVNADSLDDTALAVFAREIMSVVNEGVNPNLTATAYIATVAILNVCINLTDKPSDEQVLRIIPIIDVLKGSILSHLTIDIINHINDLMSLVKKELSNAVGWLDSMEGDIQAIQAHAAEINDILKGELKQALGV